MESFWLEFSIGVGPRLGEHVMVEATLETTDNEVEDMLLQKLDCDPATTRVLFSLGDTGKTFATGTRFSKYMCHDQMIPCLLQTGCRQLFVKHGSGRTLTVNVTDLHSIEVIKKILQNKTGISLDSMRLTYGGRELEDRKLLSDYGIGANSTVEMTSRVIGGTSISVGEFTNVELEPTKGKFSDSAPKWRKVGPGMTLLGKCENDQCPSFKSPKVGAKEVCCGFGFDTFNLIDLEGKEQKAKCPMCTSPVKVTRPVFSDCIYKYSGMPTKSTTITRVVGQTSRSAKEQLHVTKTAPFKSTPEDADYIIWKNTEEGTIKWNTLTLSAVKKSAPKRGNTEKGGSDDCSICLKSMQDGHTKTPCGHCFHANCLSEWGSKNYTCPICRTSLNSDSAVSSA